MAAKGKNQSLPLNSRSAMGSSDPIEPMVDPPLSPGGVTQRWYVLGDVGIRWRQAIRNVFEPKGRKAIERVGASGFKKAFVVELCVHKGYVEAFVVEELGYFKHWVYVALCWEWYANCMRLLSQTN